MPKFEKTSVSRTGIYALVKLDEKDIAQEIPLPHRFDELDSLDQDVESAMKQLQYHLDSQSGDPEEFLRHKTSLVGSIEANLDMVIQAIRKDATKLQIESQESDEAVYMSLSNLMNTSGDISALDNFRVNYRKYFNKCRETLEIKRNFFLRIEKLMIEPQEIQILMDQGMVFVNLLNSTPKEVDREEWNQATSHIGRSIEKSIYDILDKQFEHKQTLKQIIATGFISLGDMKKSIKTSEFLTAKKKFTQYWVTNIQSEDGIEKCLYDMDKLCQWISESLLPEVKILETLVDIKKRQLSVSSGEDKISSMMELLSVEEFAKAED